MIDQNMQTVLTVGMPTLAVLVGILVNNSRLSDLRSYMEGRFSSLEQRMDSRFSALEQVMDARFKAVDSRFEAAHQALLRVEGVLDARLSHLEGRQ